MAEPAKDMMYSGSVDDEINGDFESADKPSGPADISPSEIMDAVQDQSGLVQSAKHAAETPDSHMNGHSAQTSHLPNGHDPSADPEEGSTKAASGQQAEPQEEPWKKRLYFVRMPKFPEENQYASKALQEEMDVYRSQVQLLNESLNIVRMQRNSAKESVAEARENLNAATSAFKAKRDEVEPLQKGRKDQSDLQRNFQAEFRDLDVKSEQELDAKIREMEYIMAHESIPIAQERQMVKHIKKLRDQRQRVRQYEEMYAGVETARAAARSGQGELKELLQERQVLYEDQQLQYTIFDTHRSELQALDKKINEIRDERSRVKEMQDGAYHRLQAIKQQSRGKKDAYYQNRRFSQDVRKMIREGKLDEARQMCEEQTSAALGHLQSDPDWRQEYLDLWMHQRPPPFRITFDDYDFDEVPNKASDGQQGTSGKGKGSAGKGNRASPAAAAPAPAMTAKERARAIIDASFKEVQQDMARKANAGAANEAVPGSEPSLPTPAALRSSERKAESKPSKPSKPAAKPAKPVEAPPAAFQAPEPFVPPPAVSKVESAPKDKAADSEAAAAAAREAQVRAQQEGQRRKEKAAERKQKANQKRLAREAELKAQEAKAKAEAAAQQKSQSDTSADSDTQDSSQPLATASDTAATATSALSSAAAAAAAAASDKVSASVKEAPRKVLNQAAKKSEGLKRKLEAPKAKKVPRKKNWQAYARQFSRSIVQWGQAYPAQFGLIGIVLLMTLMVFALLNRSSTSTSQHGATLST